MDESDLAHAEEPVQDAGLTVETNPFCGLRSCESREG